MITLPEERIVRRRLWVPMFLALVILVTVNCKKENINWQKVDPKFKMEFDRKDYPPDSLIAGIALTDTSLTGKQTDSLEKEGIHVVSVSGNIATIQFPIRSLQFLTGQPFIIRISKPTTQKPVSKP